MKKKPLTTFQKKARRALKKLVKISADPRYSATDRAMAMQFVLDRTLGKPVRKKESA